jgi:UDP-glucose 4-epimerase
VQLSQNTQGDLRLLSSGEWDAWLEGLDAVFHLAATVSIPACQQDPVASEENNVGVTLRLLEAVRRRRQAAGRAPAVFFASSAAVYGSAGDSGEPLREGDVPDRFLSFYAAQKWAGEQLLHQYSAHFGVPALSFRFFNVYGLGQDPASPYSGVISRFLHFQAQGQPLLLEGGGTAVRDFIHVEDLAELMARALRLPLQQLNGRGMNLGTGQSHSIRELAEAFEQCVARAGRKFVGIQAAPPRPGDVRVSRADVSRAREWLGAWTCRGLAQGLGPMVV